MLTDRYPGLAEVLKEREEAKKQQEIQERRLKKLVLEGRNQVYLCRLEQNGLHRRFNGSLDLTSDVAIGARKFVTQKNSCNHSPEPTIQDVITKCKQLEI
jgi:hypothetical protein